MLWEQLPKRNSVSADENFQRKRSICYSFSDEKLTKLFDFKSIQSEYVGFESKPSNNAIKH